MEIKSSSFLQASWHRYRTQMLFAAIVLFYLFSGTCYLRTQSVTSDENSFYLYAKRWASGHPERIDPVTDDSKTPVIVLNLLPRALAQLMHPGLHKTDNGTEDIINARFVSLLFSVLCVWLVFRWATELFGTKAGLFAAFLLALEPNFLANAALVTTDGYSTFFLLAVLYSLWKLLNERSWRWLAWFSVSVAGAQLVKQSLVHLYLVLPVIIAADLLFRRRLPVSSLLKGLLLFALIQWLLINLGYYFYGSNSRLSDYHFFSHLFQGIQRSLPGGLIVPFPKPFLQAFDMTKYFDETGSGFGNVTILGHSGQGHGYWYYYFVSLFFKSPIVFPVLLLWAVFLLWKRGGGDGVALRCLLFPPVYFLCYFSFFYKVQIGIRHIVFLLPLLCIFLGLVAAKRAGNSFFLLPALMVYLLFSHLFYWQHQFSYTNEFITDKTFAFRYVGSANIDYHQGFYWGNRYLSNHPDVHWADSIAGPGRFLIPVQQYMDIYNRHKTDWLRCHMPYGHVAFSNLLIEIKPDALKPR